MAEIEKVEEDYIERMNDLNNNSSNSNSNGNNKNYHSSNQNYIANTDDDARHSVSAGGHTISSNSNDEHHTNNDNRNNNNNNGEDDDTLGLHWEDEVSRGGALSEIDATSIAVSTLTSTSHSRTLPTPTHASSSLLFAARTVAAEVRLNEAICNLRLNDVEVEARPLLPRMGNTSISGEVTSISGSGSHIDEHGIVVSSREAKEIAIRASSAVATAAPTAASHRAESAATAGRVPNYEPRKSLNNMNMGMDMSMNMTTTMEENRRENIGENVSSSSSQEDIIHQGGDNTINALHEEEVAASSTSTATCNPTLDTASNNASCCISSLGPGAYRVYPSANLTLCPHELTTNTSSSSEDEQLHPPTPLLHAAAVPTIVEQDYGLSKGIPNSANGNPASYLCQEEMTVIEALPVAIPLEEPRSSFSAVVRSAAVPPSAMSVTAELKNNDTILTRQALVHEVITKLQEDDPPNVELTGQFDESQNVVLLQGFGGAGKSVLCSMVVSHHSTLLHFADGIAWLSLSQVRGESSTTTFVGMSYEIYVEYLTSICHQLDLELPAACSEPIILPTDSDSIRRKKVRGAMDDAKVGMSRLLANRSVLIVLDDVWSRSAVSWLNFGNRVDSSLRVLISTRLRGGFCRANAVEVGALSLEEATALLVSESGFHAELSQEERSSAIDLATRCSLLPVAICMAGRMLASSNYGSRGFEQLAIDVSETIDLDDSEIMFDLTDRCFAGLLGATDPHKMAFVAFASIFTSNEGKRSLVPTNAAIKLIGALLLSEDRKSLASCGINGPFFLLQQLFGMGLLERHECGFKVHHDCHQTYARQILNDKRQRNVLFEKRISSSIGGKEARMCTRNAKRLVGALHLIFVQSYRDAESNWESGDDDGYCFLRLPWHMVASLQPVCSSRHVLLSPSFLKQRINSMGLSPGIKAHLQDIEALNTISLTTRDKNCFEDTVNTTFEMISEHIDADEVLLLEAGKAYILLALYFQHHFRFSDSMGMLSKALVSFQREGLAEEDALIKWVRAHAEKISFAPVHLIPQSSSSPDIIRFADVDSLLALQEKAVSSDTQSLCGSTHSSSDAVMLKLSSHPGHAICLSEIKQSYPGCSFQTLCIGPSESAISIKIKANKFVTDPDDRSYLCAGASSGGEGDNLYLAIPSKICSMKYNRTNTSDLIVNEDGSMSPRSRPDLVFAVRSSPQLVLLKRDSPCRILLKHGSELQAHQVRSVSHDSTVDNDKVFSTELVSHPGKALTYGVEGVSTSKLSGNLMILGDSNSSDAIQVAYDGRKLAAAVDESFSGDGSGYKCKYNLTMALGSIRSNNSFPYLIRDEGGTIYRDEFGYGLHWIINDDGSLSPKGTTNYALGLNCLSLAELMVTDEQRVIAKLEAKISCKQGRGQAVKHGLRIICLLFL